VTTAFPVAAQAAQARPSGAAFDIVLLLHVACVIVGLGTVVVSGVQAARLQRMATGPLPTTLRDYFAPGVNWAGRVLYGVPIFGFALLGMSKGAYGLGEGWVLGGLALWFLAALAAEGLLWPAERRIQTGVAAGDDGPPSPEVRRDCRAAWWAAIGLVVVLMAGVVLMFAQP
jgi:uncharacterized membrane protein